MAKAVLTDSSGAKKVVWQKTRDEVDGVTVTRVEYE